MKALRILAANDQASFRQKMQEMTQAIPWASIVAEAKNGLEAIELVKRHRPDVVLMDIVMPGMSGIEATRRIKNSWQPMVTMPIFSRCRPKGMTLPCCPCRPRCQLSWTDR